MLHRHIVISAVILLAGCDQELSPKAASIEREVPLETSTAQETGRSKAMEVQETNKAPVTEDFNSYATEDVGNEQLCVAGTLTDADGMNQEAYLYLLKKRDRSVVWGKPLGRPADTFQSRATHCTGSEDSLYVLLQADTQSQQELSQTLLRVIKLNRDDGTIVFDKTLTPNGADVYSASVAEGEAHFTLEKRRLTVKGAYVTFADRDNPIEFTQYLDVN